LRLVLVVEDEVPISRVLAAYLRQAGFRVEAAFDGKEALDRFEALQPDLVILDVMLPEMDGWEVLKQIRSRSSCPVIMLTALGEMHQRVAGLNEGADDYVTKPFAPEEVVARVRAVLRRPRPMVRGREIAQFGSLKIDFDGHCVFLRGKRLSLTPRDFSLLSFFARHPNRTFSRDQLLDRVWGWEYEGSDRAVDLAVKRLRKALKEWPKAEGEIITLRGVGYQFRVYES
jgi:DNA-binding response OmpR family regulator